MTSEPTRGASEQHRTWNRSPWKTAAIRLLAVSIPVVVAWISVRLTSSVYYRPAGAIGTVAWMAQGLVVAALSSVVTDRYARRLLPLAALMNLSLVFPDAAPSRFGVALRTGSARRLRQRIDRIASDGNSAGAAHTAEQALELVAALGHHDRRTRGHTERVRAYAEVIAEELGLTEADRLRLAWGVLLHDVGKLGVPSEVLNKVEKLTDEEWATLRGHPAAAVDLLAPLGDWLGDWILAASEHHERWDGKGYPLGLAGTEISLAGRITAVADAYDVITSKRSYKEPMSVEAARQELVRCAGTQFDPAVVRAFLNVSVRNRWAGGPLAWLFELPSFGQVGSSLGGAAATVTAAGATTLAAITGGAFATGPELPESLALVSVDDASTSDTSAFTSTVTVAAESGAPDTTLDPPPPSSSIDDPPAVPPGGSTDTAGPTTSATGTSSGPTTTAPAGRPATTSQAPTTSTAPAGTAPASSAPSSTTASTTAPPAAPLHLFLTNPGTGNTSSAPSLPLATVAPAATPLPNYDTDRDAAPGLMIQRDSNGLNGADTTKFQDWTWTAPSVTTLSGSAELELWLSEKDQVSGETIGLRVALYVCTPACTLVRQDDWSGQSVGGYSRAVFDLGGAQQTVQMGQSLRLRITAHDTTSAVDVAVAYDTADFPARLSIG